MRARKTITRRDFLKGTAGLLLASSGLTATPHSATAQAKTRVVVIRNMGKRTHGVTFRHPKN